jgi:hypothetical protein
MNREQSWKMGVFSSSVSLMVRLGVFFDVHSPLWVAVQLHYRQQRHWFWLGLRGVGQRSNALLPVRRGGVC